MNEQTTILYFKAKLDTMKNTLHEMRNTWDSLAAKSQYNYISHLQAGASWNLEEFHNVGVRFVEQMLRRYSLYGSYKSADSAVLEIGCGIGRFLKILACHFKKAIGVDISAAMLENAQSYCCCMPNVSYVLTNGNSLHDVTDSTVEFVVSAGVFQHIIDQGVVIAYIKEALRVLKPGGLFLFQFEGTRVHAVGEGQHGARIDAALLNEALQSCPFTIREISCDLRDPVRNMVIVLEKLENDALAQKDFASFPMTPSPWILGVYDSVHTKTNMHERLQKPPVPLTFYSQHTKPL